MFQVGRWSFPTKKAAEEKCREILKNSAPGNRLTGEDAEFALALIDMNPKRDQIYSGGLDYNICQLDPQGYKRFCAVRNRHPASRLYDWSWRDSLTPPDHRQRLSSLLRWLIWPQIEEFREKKFRGCCEACSHIIPKRDAQVDHHDPPFDKLVDRWLEMTGIPAEGIPIEYSDQYETASSINPTLEASWLAFHRNRSKLRVVCRGCNLGPDASHRRR